MALVFFFLLFLFILLPFYFLSRSNNQKPGLPRPPGPPSLPLIGNMHQFDSCNPHLYLFQLSKKYGPFMSLRLGSIPTLIISSASAAKQVYTTHDIIFSGRPALAASQKLSYSGLDVGFSPYNDYWRSVRKICTLHLFSTKRSQSFRPIREGEVGRMIKTIRDGAANVFNLSECVIGLTSSVICMITFGKRYGRFHWLLAETQATLAGFFVSDYFPMLGWIDKLSGASGRLEKSFKEIDEFYQQLIDEHLQLYQSGIRPSTSILDILLQMKMESPEFKFENIKALFMNILVAGADTSAASVLWAMTFLMKNPSTMKKIKEEVRQLIGRKGFVDEDDVQKLMYLKSVVKETMRLFPPTPLLLPRETTKKCDNLGGYEIEAKTLVYVNAWAIGRDPEVWKNPDEFIPERFMNSGIDFKGQDFELVSFGGGRRMCPGMTMGLATAELVLANLVYSFDWEMPPGKKIQDIDMLTLPGVTMHRKNDLLLVPILV